MWFGRTCCVASRTLWIWRYAGNVGGRWGTRPGVWECEAGGPACNKDRRCRPGAVRAFDGLACARLGSQEFTAVGGKARLQGGRA